MNNVVYIEDLRRPSPTKARGVYLRITDQNVVQYGLEEVGADDVPRLLKALFALRPRLVEIDHE